MSDQTIRAPRCTTTEHSAGWATRCTNTNRAGFEFFHHVVSRHVLVHADAADAEVARLAWATSPRRWVGTNREVVATELVWLERGFRFRPHRPDLHRSAASSVPPGEPPR